MIAHASHVQSWARAALVTNIVLALVVPLTVSAAPHQSAEARQVVALSAEQRMELEKRAFGARAACVGRKKNSRCSLEPYSLELALTAAQGGDDVSRRWAVNTLDSGQLLLDRVWGGVYGSFVGEVQQRASFSKELESQALVMMLFAYAYRVLGEERYLAAARSIASYMRSFLRDSDGAYMSGQSGEAPGGLSAARYFALDDEGRRARGLPTVFGTKWTDENGMAILALTEMFLTTGDEAYLRDAAAAAQWVIAQRGAPGGGFRHGSPAATPAHLADTAWMGRALLGLYAATGERSWLARAREAASSAGLDVGRFLPAQGSSGVAYCTPDVANKARRELSPRDAISVARLENAIYRNVGDLTYRQRSLEAHSLATCLQGDASGLLLAGKELDSEPLHVTTVGAKGDPAAQALFAASWPIPAVYVRREWWDRAEGQLPNPDVQYPRLPRAAAFVCEEQGCSLPLYGADELTSRIARALSPK